MNTTEKKGTGVFIYFDTKQEAERMLEAKGFALHGYTVWQKGDRLEARIRHDQYGYFVEYFS